MVRSRHDPLQAVSPLGHVVVESRPGCVFVSAFHTFPIYIQSINESEAYPAAAVTLMSFGITWAAMLSLLVIGRKRGARGAVIAGVR